MELDSRVALITGGAVRLGRVLAQAEAGVRLAVHYNSCSGPADETVAENRDLGSDALVVQGDLGQPSQAPTLIERAVARCGPVDILVNSAAIFEPADLAHTMEASWDRRSGINLKSPFFLSQAFAEHLGPERCGHIVSIADWRGLRPDPDYLSCSLIKAGVLAMTRGLSLALAPNIQVNAIAPGATLPPLGKDQAHLDQLAEAIPLEPDCVKTHLFLVPWGTVAEKCLEPSRVPCFSLIVGTQWDSRPFSFRSLDFSHSLERVGSPGEIARTTVYLLKSDFVTGEAISVTGREHLT